MTLRIDFRFLLCFLRSHFDMFSHDFQSFRSKVISVIELSRTVDQIVNVTLRSVRCRRRMGAKRTRGH